MRYTVEPDEEGQGWWVEDAKGNPMKHYDRSDHAARLASTLNEIDEEIYRLRVLKKFEEAEALGVSPKVPPAPANWEQQWQGTKIQGALPNGEDD